MTSTPPSAPRASHLAKLRSRIAEQATGSPWRTFVTEAGQTYRVLSVVFDSYARTSRVATPSMSVWRPVSPMGLKTAGDDTWHSDWLLTMETLRDGEWRLAFDDPRQWYDAMNEDNHNMPGSGLFFGVYLLTSAVQDFYDGLGPDPVHLDLRQSTAFPARPVVLRVDPMGPSTWEGPVICPAPDEEVEPGSILFVPCLGPDYYVPAASAGPKGLVVSRVGGEMAHLVSVSRDHPNGFPALVVWPNNHVACGARIRASFAGTPLIEELT